MGDGIMGIIKLFILGVGCVIVLNVLEGCKAILK